MTEPDTLQADFNRLMATAKSHPRATVEPPFCPTYGCHAPGWIDETPGSVSYTLTRPCPEHKPAAYRAWMDGKAALKAYWNGKALETKAEAEKEEKAREKAERAKKAWE